MRTINYGDRVTLSTLNKLHHEACGRCEYGKCHLYFDGKKEGIALVKNMKAKTAIFAMPVCKVEVRASNV